MSRPRLYNEQGQDVAKTRIILDAKKSQVTAATARRYKSELPRVTDALHDILALMSNLKPGDVLAQMIADITDAFWLIPLHPAERRFFVAKLHKKSLILKRTILAFLQHNSPESITKRSWDVNGYLAKDKRVVITWDASPWGFGATLTIDGIVCEFLYDVPAGPEIELLQIQVGESF